MDREERLRKELADVKEELAEMEAEFPRLKGVRGIVRSKRALHLSAYGNVLNSEASPRMAARDTELERKIGLSMAEGSVLHLTVFAAD